MLMRSKKQATSERGEKSFDRENFCFCFTLQFMLACNECNC